MPAAASSSSSSSSSSSGTSWLTDELQAAFGALVEGAGLGGDGLTWSVALVVPATAGRPRRSRSSSTAAAAASEAPVQGTLEVDGGRVVRWIPGEVAADAVATLTLPAPDARELLEGAVEPSVLFMQGRLKVDGDMAAVLALLRATTTDGYGRGRATLEGSAAHG